MILFLKHPNIMKQKFFPCALAAAALLLSGCGILGKASPEEEARTAALVEQRLDARSFRVDIESMSPMRGPRRMLTTPYSVTVHEGKVDSHLPYMGEAYNVPYGGGKVLTFKDDIEQYIEDYSRPDRRIINFTTDNDEDYILYHFEIFPNGKATLRVSSHNRQAIDYMGTVDVDFDPAKPEGE